MPGPATNTLYYGDCLDWLQQWPDECIDLIYLDPPFNSNADYNIIFGTANGTPAQVRGFNDTWKWDTAAAERTHRLRSAVAHPMHDATESLHRLLGPSGMLSYLTYMGERLAELRRVLKPTGNLVLHCDDTASHYLKVVLDSIFGSNQYRNDISWRRAAAHNDANRFGRIVDHLLFYGKSSSAYWNGDAGAQAKDSTALAKAYPAADARGRYRSDNLTGPSHRTSPDAPSATPWRDYDVFSMGRVWSVPRTGAYAEFIEQEFIPDYRNIGNIHARLDALDAAGLIHHPARGRWPGLKRYAEADQGLLPQSLITEPTGYTNYSSRKPEYLGYQTQKPPALLQQLFAPTCPPSGFLLDPFCGCGSSALAAESLGLEWAGIDISSFAIDLIQRRQLSPKGIHSTAQGIPYDMQAAQKLALDRPFDFEAWAIQRVPGLMPNERRGGDGGIDGRGKLLARPADSSGTDVIAQVKGKRRFVLSDFRDFLHTVNRDNAAIGVFITLHRVDSSRARAEAAAFGTVTIGSQSYPRVQMWSIFDYFEGVQPNVPTLADPYTGKAMEPILFSDQSMLEI